MTTHEHEDRRRRIAAQLIEMAMAVVEDRLDDLPAVLRRDIEDAGLGEK